MSIWQLLKMLVKVLFGYRSHRRSMEKIRDATAHMGVIEEIMGSYRKGDYESALKATEQLQQRPEFTASYFFFSGTMLMNLGRLDEAEQFLRRNVTSAPDNKRKALGYSSLGQVLLEMNRIDEAVQCFETSLKYWPQRGSAHRDIAEAWLRRGSQSGRAVEFAQLAVKEDRERENPTGYKDGQEVCNLNLGEDLATLAWAVAVDSHDRAEVDQLVSEAVPLMASAVSPSAQVHYHSGRAYLELGDHQKSSEYFAAAVRIDPNGMWGRAARKMMDGVPA